MELNLYEINEFNKELKNLNQSLNNEDNKQIFEYSQTRVQELKEELKEIQINQIQNDGNLTRDEWLKKDFLEKEIAKNEEKISKYEEEQKDIDKKIFKKRVEKEDIKKQLKLEEAKIDIELAEIQKRWNDAMIQINENEETIKQLRIANQGLDENSEEVQKNLEEILELQNKNQELTKVMQENVITSKKAMELKKQQEDIKTMKNILENGTVLEGIENPNIKKQEEPIQEEPIQEEPVQEEPIQEEPVQEEPVQEEPVQEEPVQEEPVQEEPVQEEPVQEEPVQEEPVQEEPVQEEPVQEEPVQEEPVQEKPVQEKSVQEKSVQEEREQEKLHIRISAKDKAVYINGELSNIKISKVFRNKEKIDTAELSEILDTKNLIKIWNVKRKLDPVIIDALATNGRIGDYSNYINSIYQGTLEEKYGMNIEYDLKDSSFTKSTDRKMQKYARHANKVDGIVVDGLKEIGPKAWFNAFMDKVKTLRLPAGEERIQEEEIKISGFKAMDQEAIRLQKENEKELREKSTKNARTEEGKKWAETIDAKKYVKNTKNYQSPKDEVNLAINRGEIKKAINEARNQGDVR